MKIKSPTKFGKKLASPLKTDRKRPSTSQPSTGLKGF